MQTYNPLPSFPLSSNDLRCGIGEVGWERDSTDAVIVALDNGALGREKFRADFDLNPPLTNEFVADEDWGRSWGMLGGTKGA